MRTPLLAAAALCAAAGIATLAMGRDGPAAVADPHPLGDLSAMSAIVADTQAIAATGDLAAAEARATDLETAWDEAEPTLRPMDATAWASVDDAADAAFAALRARTPDPARVTETLAALAATLEHPVSGPATDTTILRPDGTVATADANGRPFPCEDMAAALRDLSPRVAGLAAKDQEAVADLQARGLERCNADDDARADDFLGQAITLAAQG